MTALNAVLPQMEAATTDAMHTTLSMFAMMTGKYLTVDEGHKLLTLWSMVNKTDASAAAMMPPSAPVVAPVNATAAPAVTAPVPSEAAEAVKVSPSMPASVISSDPFKTSVAAPVVVAEQPRVTMPPVEEIQIPGVEQPLRRVVNHFRSNSKYWTDGFNWRIDVIPFDKDNWEGSYFVHFREKPTQAEFDEHYAHFLAKENRCKVHIMESDGTSSRRITDEYCTFRERGDLNFHTKETLNPHAEWEEGARFRVVFNDVRIGGQKNYMYFANKPTQSQIDKLSFAKGCVVTEKRPDHPND